MTPVTAAVIVLAAVAAVLLLMMWWIQSSRRLRGAAKSAIEKAWKHAQGQTSNTLKIVEADKTLEEALRLLGFSGSLGQMMVQAGGRFSDRNGIWWAHKLRNKLVHELDAGMSDEHTVAAMKAYRRALADLGANV